MDKLSPERRSWLMARVKSKNTSPELLVRRLVFSMGYRYRLHVKALPGKPDLVFLGRRKVIFVHGCFWHGHPECRYARIPKTRPEFWRDKQQRNAERDFVNESLLKQEGWKVMTIWQCELKDLEGLSARIREFLNNA